MSQFGWRAVLFDLDGTLRYSVPAANETLLSRAVAMGARDDAARRQRALRWAHFYWANSQSLLRDLRRFPMRDDRFWVRYTLRQLLAFGCSLPQARKLAPGVQAFFREQYQPEDRFLPGLSDTLSALREAGYLLGVLSNRPQAFHDYIAAQGLTPYFDLILSAGEVGAWKPSRRAFHAAVERMNVAPAEAVYVGDNYFADVLGARRAGLFPLLVDPDKLFEGMSCVSVAMVTQVTPEFLEALVPLSQL